MKHSFGVNVVYTLNNLSEDELGIIFLQFSSPSDIGKEVTTSTNLHDVYNMSWDLKAFVKSHNVLLSGSLKDVVFLSNLLEGVLVLHESLVD